MMPAHGSQSVGQVKGRQAKSDGLETNGDCNEDQGQAVGQEVKVVQGQKLVIRGGSIIEFWK